MRQAAIPASGETVREVRSIQSESLWDLVLIYDEISSTRAEADSTGAGGRQPRSAA